MDPQSINEQITEFTKQNRKILRKYVLENIKEVSRSNLKEIDSDASKTESFGKFVDLDYNGTRCLGKSLHPIFFDFGKTPDSSKIQSTLEKVFSEIKLLSEMKHPNILRFIGIFYKETFKMPTFVVEKIECSLTHYLSTHEKRSIPDDKVLNILLGVSKGMVYLHEEIKVAHGDLCSNNIHLTADLSAKIADLGSARVLERPGGWNPPSKSIDPKTISFMPPEFLKDPPEYTILSDVFSFGCVIIHLNTHKWPLPTP